MADNEVRNRVVTEFTAENVSSFAQQATGAAAAMGAIVLAQNLWNQAMAAAVAPLNTIISLNSQRDAQLRSMASALVAQQAIGATRAVQAAADAAAAGTAELSTRMIKQGSREFSDLAGAAEGAFRKSATSAGTFTRAMQAAQQMMRMMVVDAAALPGEVNDYATAMQIASSSVIQAVAGTRHSNVSSVMHFVNNLTAAGINAGIDSAQAGRDIMRMMTSGRGQAGLDVRTWTEVIAPYARDNRGNQLSATQFNALNAERRFEVLARVGNDLRNIMNQSADSWEAVLGALSSARNELIQQATAPIYKQIQSGLARFSAWLNDGVEHGTSLLQRLTRVGEALSDVVLVWVKPIIERIASLSSRLGEAGEAIRKNYFVNRAADLMGEGMARLQRMITSPITSWQDAIRSGVSNLGVLFPNLVVFGGLLRAIIQGGSGMTELWLSLQLAAGVLWDALKMVGPVLSAFTDVVTMAFEAVAGPVGYAITILAVVFRTAATIVGGFLIGFATVLSLIMVPATLVIEVFKGVVQIVIWIIRVLLLFAEAIISIITPVHLTFAGFIHAMQSVRDTMRAAAESIRWAFARLGLSDASPTSMAEELVNPNARENTENETIGRMRRAWAAMSTAMGNINLTSPPQRPVSQTNNDFRFSRFDITQRFAEGFDPDRIATFFQRDIANAANQRTESGMIVPAFST
jgi:hypothetical protein